MQPFRSIRPTPRASARDSSVGSSKLERDGRRWRQLRRRPERRARRFIPPRRRRAPAPTTGSVGHGGTCRSASRVANRTVRSAARPAVGSASFGVQSGRLGLGRVPECCGRRSCGPAGGAEVPSGHSGRPAVRQAYEARQGRLWAILTTAMKGARHVPPAAERKSERPEELSGQDGGTELETASRCREHPLPSVLEN